jgi:opine dehydrogenase
VTPVVAVLGAGNVGCALAGDLARRGVDVRLFNRTPERLAPIQEAGGLTLTGRLEGFAKLPVVTTVLEEALSGAGVLAVCVPATALPAYAPLLATAAGADHVIWLNPGQSGGALYLAAEIERLTGRRDLRICQLTTSAHTARMPEPATVRVLNLSRVGVAAFPNRHAAECHDRLDALLPDQFDRIDSVLESDLLNLNALLHPPGMVLNAGWVEATGGGFTFYDEGMTPAVGRMVDEVDAERRALAERLGVPTITLVDALHRAGFTTAEGAASGRTYDAVKASTALGTMMAPASLDHRYLHEDVGWGLVPWTDLARAVGVAMPATEALVDLAGVMNVVDYRDTGLTLARMGLAGISAGEISDYARLGPG